MQKAVARWSGQKVKFEIRANSGHNADVDEPPAFGDDEGMRPTEMLLIFLFSNRERCPETARIAPSMPDCVAPRREI